MLDLFPFFFSWLLFFAFCTSWKFWFYNSCFICGFHFLYLKKRKSLLFSFFLLFKWFLNKILEVYNFLFFWFLFLFFFQFFVHFVFDVFLICIVFGNFWKSYLSLFFPHSFLFPPFLVSSVLFLGFLILIIIFVSILCITVWGER